ncbi:IS66 family insertion sequence element accessory protein TnpA [Leptospira weilii]
MREWKESGLNQDEFCASRNLSPKAFNRWKGKLMA